LGKRKTALKKNNPNRHKALVLLRNHNYIENFVMKNGVEVAFNPMKTFLMLKEYKHEEFKKGLMRLASKIALGEKKYNEMSEAKGLAEAEKIMAEAGI